MNSSWNNKKIIEKVKENGFYIFENYFDEKDINKIKKTLLDTLNYIKPNEEQDLQKKYYQIRNYNPKLKSHWYDLAAHDINLLQLLHNSNIVKFVKEYYKTDVVFSGRPCINVHDDENVHLLEPHQETAQFARDHMIVWSPLYDTNQKHGGLVVYKDSHKHGYFDHFLNNPHIGKKGWTNEYTRVDPAITKRFKRLELEVKAGTAVFFLSSCIHGGYANKTKDHVRITVTERYNPLQKIPFLKDENAEKKMPYIDLDSGVSGSDYNKMDID